MGDFVVEAATKRPARVRGIRLPIDDLSVVN